MTQGRPPAAEVAPRRDCRNYGGWEYGNNRFLCHEWDNGEKLTPSSACQGCRSYDPVNRDTLEDLWQTN